MKVIEITNNGVDEDKLLGRFAAEEDVPLLISEDTLLTVKGVPTILYKRTNWNCEALRDALNAATLTSFTRQSTVPFKSNSATFGFRPRNPLRKRPCSVSEFNMREPDLTAMLEQWTNMIAEVYRAANPAVAAEHDRIAKQVRSNYRIGQSMFTSGIVNRSSQLPYHYDSGNFKGAWSAMLGLRRGVRGGRLNIPRYGISLDIADGSLCFFNGQEALHGVTPMERTQADGERYTIVWYSIEKMWKCLTTKEELATANAMVTRSNQRKGK